MSASAYYFRLGVLALTTFGLLCSLLALSSCNFITMTVTDETDRPTDVLPVLEVSDIGDDYPYQLNIGLFRWIATAPDKDFSFADQDMCLDYTGRFSEGDSPFDRSFRAAQYGSLLAPLLSTVALLLIYLDTCMVSFPTKIRMNYILGTLLFLAVLCQGLTFLVLREDDLCQDDNNSCDLSGGAGASLAAMCSYFLAFFIACVGIKGQVKPVCGIVWSKMMKTSTDNKGGNDDNNDKDKDATKDADKDGDEKKEQPRDMKEASGEETDKEKLVVLKAAAETTTNDDKEPEQAAAATAAVVDIQADLADMEEGLAIKAAADGEQIIMADHPKAQSPSISMSQSEPQPPAAATSRSLSEVPDASKDRAVDVDEEHVESSETALLSSPYTFLDTICCGSPTSAATTAATTTNTGLPK